MRPLLISPTLAAMCCGFALAALGGCKDDDGSGASGGTGPAAPSVSISPAASASATQAAFTVQRTGATDQALAVSLSAADASAAGDYSAPASVTIPAGAPSAQVTVARSANAAFDGPRTVTLTVAAGSGYVPGAAASAQGTMADLDLPQVAGTYSGSFTPVTGVAAGRGRGGGGGLSLLGLVIVPSPSLFLAAAPVAWTVDLSQSGAALSGYYVDDRGFSGPVSGTVDATGALALTVAVEGAPAGSSAAGTIAIAATVQPDAGSVRGVIAASSPAVTEAFSATSSSGTTSYAGEAQSTMAGAGTSDGSPAQPSGSSVLGFWTYDGNDTDLNPRRYVYLNGAFQRLDAWDQPVTPSTTSVSGNQVVMWRDQGASFSPASQRYIRDTWAITTDGSAMDPVTREVSGDNAAWSTLAPYSGRFLRAAGSDPWFRLHARSLAVDGSASEWGGADLVNDDPSGDTMSSGNSSTDLRELWMCVNYVSGNPSSLGLFAGLSGHPADAGTTDASSPFGSYRVDIIKRNGSNYTLFAGLGSIASNPTKSDPWPLSGNIKDGSGSVVANGPAQGVEVYSNGVDSIEAGLPVTALGVGSGSRFLVRVKTTSTSASGGLTYDRTRTILVTIPQAP